MLPLDIPILLLMIFSVYSIFCNISPGLVGKYIQKLLFICCWCQYCILDKFAHSHHINISPSQCPLYVLSNLKHFLSGYMSNLHDKRDSVVILHAFEIPPLPYSSGPCEAFVTVLFLFNFEFERSKLSVCKCFCERLVCHELCIMSVQ